MASSVIGALRVNLGLDSAQFERGAKRVRDPLKKMRLQFLAVAGAAAALGAAISKAALTSARDIDKTAKAARRLGTSIEGYRALELAAGSAGVTLSRLTSDVQTMDREIARGTKGATAALDKLGLSVREITGLEADEKIALIADRVKALGLTSGEATALLRDLGIRNREMVLAVMDGGDAFRDARKDIRDYGLAIDAVDSKKIEVAVDRISSLGLIGQYVGQQLAIKLVPVLGNLAHAMTESLRAGGLLRNVIDGIVDNLGRLASYAAAAVSWFGVRLVGAFVAARVAAVSLSGALVLLRGALIRTGIGAVIVAAGELAFQFAELVRASGGFGAALGALSNVASEVWERIKRGGMSLKVRLHAIWDSILGAFLAMVARIREAWAKLMAWLADKTSLIPKISGIFKGMAEGAEEAAAAERKLSEQYKATAENAHERASALARGVMAPVESIKALGDIMRHTSEETESAVSSVRDLGEELGKLDEAGGAQGGAGARSAADKLKETVAQLSTGAQEMKTAFGTAFEGLVTGAKSAKEAVADLLNSLAKVLVNQAFTALWGGLFPGGGGLSIPGFATGTPSAPGGMALVGERGPELVNLPRGSRVLNANQTRNAMTGGKQQLEVILHAPEGFTAEQVREVQGISFKVTEARFGARNRSQNDKRYLGGTG